MKRFFLLALIALGLGSVAAVAQKQQVANIRKAYAAAKDAIAKNGNNGRAPMDMQITLNDGSYIDDDLTINDITVLQFFFNRKPAANFDKMYGSAQCFFITENWSAYGHSRYREMLFDADKGCLLFSYMRGETHAGFVVESRYYYDANGQLIDQKHKTGDGETTTAQNHTWSDSDGDKALAAKYLSVFDMMVNGKGAVEHKSLTTSGQKLTKADRMKMIRERYAEAKRKMAENDKSDLPKDVEIIVHDQHSASMPPEVTEVKMYFDDVVDHVEVDAVSVDSYCYFISEHHHNNRMGFDNYAEYLFAPKSSNLIFSFSNVKEEGEQHEWRYYFDENGRCIETKSDTEDTDDGAADKETAKRYVKIFETLKEY